MNIHKIEKDLPVWVRFGQGKTAIREKGVILDFTDSSEGDYYWTKVAIIKINPFDGSELVSVYPKPIQSYRLSERIEGGQERRPRTKKQAKSDNEILGDLERMLGR